MANARNLSSQSGVDVSTLRAAVEASTSLHRSVNQLRDATSRSTQSLRQMGTQLQQSAAGLRATGQAAQAMGSSLSQSMTMSLAKIALLSAAISAISFGVKLAAQAEQAEIAFGVMLGSADQAKKTLGEIRQFAAETPFEQPELINAGRKLLAFGETAESLIGTLRRMGDVSAGVGQPIGEIAELYGKARVQGRLFAEDINQFQGRGINIVAELGKQLHVSGAGVRELVSQGKVGFPELQKAFENMTNEGGKFHDMTKQQSGSIAGLWSTLSDSIAMTAQEIGQNLIKSLDLKGKVQQAIQAVDGLKNTIIGMVSRTVELFTQYGPAIAKVVLAIGSLVIAYQAVTKAHALYLSISGPAGWGVLAAGAAIYAGSLYAINEAHYAIANATDQATEATKQKTAAEEAHAAAIRRTAEAEQQYQRLMDASIELKEKYRTKAQQLALDLKAIESQPFLSGENRGRMRFEAIDKASGIITAIRSANEEIERMTTGISAADQALIKMRENGAPVEEVIRLKLLNDQLAALKEQQALAKHRMDQINEEYKLRQQNAKAIVDATTTPLERFRAEMFKAQDLLKKGDISPQTFERYKKKLTDELAPRKGAETVERGSQRSMQIITANQLRRDDGSVKKLSEKQLGEQRKMAGHLQKISKAKTTNVKIVGKKR